jgi:hypothetical protein
MSEVLKRMLESGQQLLTNTKTRKPKTAPIKAEKVGLAPTRVVDLDPYRAFASRVIENKPKKPDVVEMIEEFIKKEEAKL